MHNSSDAGRMMLIPRRYLPRVKYALLAILGYFALTLLLLFFGQQFWALIPFVFFLVFTIQIIQGFKDHKLLLLWLNANPKTKIFIYSSKGKYLRFIEDELLPSLTSKVLICKNDKGSISGDIPVHIYYQLYALLSFKDLPVGISINNGMLVQSSYKVPFDLYMTNKLVRTKLEEIILSGLNKA